MPLLHVRLGRIVMCLAIPMKVEKLYGRWARVESQGLRMRVNIALTPDVKAGDHVLVHAGFAIEKLEQEIAKEDLKLWEELIRQGTQ